MARSGDAGKRQHVFCGKIGDNTQKPNGLKGLFAGDQSGSGGSAS